MTNGTDGERLAALEVEVKHMRQQQDKAVAAAQCSTRELRELRAQINRGRGMLIGLLATAGFVGYVLDRAADWLAALKG